jgi:acyl transferase domain-containing protein/3-hydroxymyristoyl/3-hydroxydecanoyl-(acyl carrier protein) dehydratase
MFTSSRVAIVGIGGLFPGAPTPEALWQHVLACADAAREPPAGRWLLPVDAIYSPGEVRKDGVPSRRACFLDPFVVELDGLQIDRQILDQLDPVFHLALEASRRAWRSARTANLDRRRVGVILGAIALPTDKTSSLTRHVLGRTLYEKLDRPCPFLDESRPHPLNVHVTGLPAGLVARALGLGGCAFTLDAACASSLYAIKLAVDELTTGRADAMLAGGLSRPDSLYTQMGFAQLRALSPTGRCSPFDARGDGLVVGEGAGVFVLKRLGDARSDGDRILGVIAGIGLSNDVEGGLLAPASEGQLRAMQAAYAQAGWRPDEIDLIECHATGTPIGDAVEFNSLKTLWRDYQGPPGRCVLGAVKSSVGHLLTGAGAAALTKVLFALGEKTLPPTANFETPAPALEMERSPFRVLRKSEPWPCPSDRPRRAAVSGFGFGGINAHLLIEEDSAPVEANPRSSTPARVVIVAAQGQLGSSTGEVLDRQLLGFEDTTPSRPSERWWGVAQSEWFRQEHQENYPGHYLDRVHLSLERFRIPPREVEEMLPQQVLMLDVAGRVIEEANLTEDVRLRTGVFIGVGLDLNTTNFHLRWAMLKHEPARADVVSPSLTANRTMGALASIAASRIARAFRLGGPAFTLSSTETSGLTALHVAMGALERREIDVAIVGAVDLAGDVRAVLAQSGVAPPCDGAVAFVLRRQEEAVGPRVCVERAHLGWGQGGEPAPVPVGDSGVVSGLASLLRAYLCLQHRLLPGERGPRVWLEDRQTVVRSVGKDGSLGSVTLTATTSSQFPNLVIPRREGLFVVEAKSLAELLVRLDQLHTWTQEQNEDNVDLLTRSWLKSVARAKTAPLAVSMIPRNRRELLHLIQVAQQHLQRQPDKPLCEAERIFYSPDPLGPRGQVAFVYPGSGNDFVGMGQELAVFWPAILHRQAQTNRDLAAQYLPQLFWDRPATPVAVQDRLFAQVALGTLVSDLLLDVLRIKPDAAIGYSLGESSALFGLGAWHDRDGMLERMHTSTLFTSDLTAPDYHAVRRAWGLSASDPVDWRTGIVERSPEEVRRALIGLEKVYLQIVNTPTECVIGGVRAEVEEVVRRLGCVLVPIPETTTMHCAVVRPVAETYRALHRWPTTPPAVVRYYSAGLGHAYDLDSETAAEAILAQALDTLDFPRVIESAYRDGIRLFVEVGPGGSCSRMISAILGDRPHVARSVCLPGDDGLAALWRLVAVLVAERVPVDIAGLYGQPATPRLRDGEGHLVEVPVGGLPFAIEPPRPRDTRPSRLTTVAQVDAPFAQTISVAGARSQAHAAFLRLDDSLRRTFESTVAFQGQLVELILAGATIAPEAQEAIHLDREQCREFAIGSIANVLGPPFAEIDSFPTRVRLPDEPLMLVDRILTIEGEPLSLSSGRVVTEHDVLSGAWYLDNGRIPMCLAVESGQADLFLSGYLGIDLRTRGLAVYRLLDAVVTFHRRLPVAGETIRYDIHIDRFFRQGDTHLFRFRFVGSVNGEPLLTMTDGCAGFFTAQELAAGKGVIQTELQLRPRPGVEPDDAGFLPTMGVEHYTAEQIDALREGDLASCFGAAFASLSLREPVHLPGGRMRLVHRVMHLDPRGGQFGMGLIRAEADIHPDDWFLTCHFIDDQVMPGTLMYECCLHTLRIFLMRLGWVGEQDEVVCEPVPGVGSRLRCRGQVTASTRTVTYEVILKERGYRPEAYAIADALMYADGKPIVEISDMCLRMSGLTRDRIEEVWRASRKRGKALYDRHHILAFATGKLTEAFGDRYSPFDEGRFIARLPAPPYSFLDRIVKLAAQPWKMVAGGEVWAEYDVATDEWYFASERAAIMPFAVLLEIPLQVCGWMAAYIGSALTSSAALHFRNLGGSAELIRMVTSMSGTLSTHVHVKRVATSAGMIIQDFDFETSDSLGLVYRAATTFGFFSAQTLGQQIGIREAKLHEPSDTEIRLAQTFAYPTEAPFPDQRLRMIDRIDWFLPDGGPTGLGFIEGSKDVRPEEWFFKAHFYQDPVMPGSLGLEAMLQLLKIVAHAHWRPGPGAHFVANLGAHRWMYRGQVIPSNKQVRVQAMVTSRDDSLRRLTADGCLSVDGLVIYRMQDFTLQLIEG